MIKVNFKFDYTEFDKLEICEYSYKYEEEKDFKKESDFRGFLSMYEIELKDVSFLSGNKGFFDDVMSEYKFLKV